MKPLRIKHAGRPFTAARDDNGVPHITAPTWADCLYGLGYLHALDRPTQLLFSRSVASGQAAARIADQPALIETDRFFRKAGLYLHLAREVSCLSPEHAFLLATYCHGVNAGMLQTGRSLPMWATGYRPDPWDLEAVLLVGNLLSYGALAVGQQQNERLLVELIQMGIDADLLRELYAPHLDQADFDLLRRVKISNRLSDEALEMIVDLPSFAGSNAWVVAPARSATGQALLASDPHLEVNRLPAIWYEAVLRWGESDYLLGATLPGCPSFAVGRTRQVSWGVTYMKGDTIDYFVEDCRRQHDQWQYRRGEQWHNFEVREEIIQRKGGQREKLLIYHNPLGTLDGDPDATGEGLYLSSAWIGQRPGAGRALTTWLDVPFASSAAALMDLVRPCPQPTLCWMVADRAGHIGMQANGWLPRRRESLTGLVPVPAWDEANHWQGLIDESILPRFYDPPEGFLVSANENINPHNQPPLISLPLPDYRKRRILKRLAELPAATLSDMQALQYDVISTQARDLLHIFLPHLPPGEVKDRLAAWDCSYAPDSYEATLFSRFYRNVLLEIFGLEHATHGMGWRRMFYLCTRAGFNLMTLTCIDRLMQKEESLWWAGRDKGELIRRAAQKLPLEPEQPWSVTNAFQFTNRFFEAPVAGRTLGFHTASLPMPGCHATPFQGHLLRAAKRETTFAPSYHFVTDLGHDEAWTNLPGGPSESRFSRWYKSDIPRWCEGVYKRLAPE